MKKHSSDSYEKLINTPIPRLTISLGIPAVVGMMITTIYNMVDTWFVAQLGTQAVGACGIVLSIMELTSSVGYWFGMGGGTTIGMLLGARKDEEAGRIGTTAFLSTLGLGVVIAALGLAFITPLMRLLGASETILPYAIAYGRFILLGFPIMSGSLVLSTILRCEGKMNFSMLGIALGGVLNIILDPVFIFKLGLGITGAALATFLSQLAGLVLLLAFYLAGQTQTKLALRLFTPSMDVYRCILVRGLASLTRHGVTTVANIAVNTAAGLWGGDMLIAALAIVTKITSLMQSVIKGIYQGAQTIFSYNKGAGRYDRVRAAWRFAVAFNTALMAVFAAVVLLKAEAIVSLFQTGDPEIIVLGARALILQALGLLMMPFNFSGNTLLQSVGESWKATFLAALPQGVFYIPALFLLPIFCGADGVLYAPAVGHLLTALTTAPVIAAYFAKIRVEESTGHAV